MTSKQMSEWWERIRPSVGRFLKEHEAAAREQFRHQRRVWPRHETISKEEPVAHVLFGSALGAYFGFIAKDGFGFLAGLGLFIFLNVLAFWIWKLRQFASFAYHPDDREHARADAAVLVTFLDPMFAV